MSAPPRASAAHALGGAAAARTTQSYVDDLLERMRPRLVDQVSRLVERGAAMPDPEQLADLLEAGMPDAGETMHPMYAAVGPFYDSAGAMLQLGGASKQALASRRSTQTVLAMRTGDHTWLYPAWQFTGQGGTHPVLAPVLRALKGLDRWAVGIWLTNEHPALDGRTPRRALREGVDPLAVARLAAEDKDALAA